MTRFTLRSYDTTGGPVAELEPDEDGVWIHIDYYTEAMEALKQLLPLALHFIPKSTQEIQAHRIEPAKKLTGITGNERRRA